MKRTPPGTAHKVFSRIQGCPAQLFAGRTCQCVLCDAVETFPADLDTTEWRMVEILGTPYYACPTHFPKVRGTFGGFQRAQESFLRAAFAKHQETSEGSHE